MKHTSGEMRMECDGSLCLGGQVLAFRLAPDGATPEEIKANHERLIVLWNASKGMASGEALAYLKFGAEIKNANASMNKAAVKLGKIYKERSRKLLKKRQEA